MADKLQLDVQEFAQIANVIDQGIFVCDISGRIDFLNPFACSFFGYDHSELIYRNIEMIADVDLRTYFSGEQKIVNGVPAKNKYGKDIFFNAKITPSPNIERYVIIVSDITRRIEGRNKLMQKIDTCERLTRSRYIRDGKLTEALQEIISESAKTLELERVNAWLIDSNFSLIECIGNYIGKTNAEQNIKLFRKDMPAYFKLLETQEIITTDDTLHDLRTAELLDSYVRPYGITSMMDVPIRIEGQMIGVVCFENTGIPRKWDLTERKFGLFIAQLISLALETTERQNSQHNLEKTIREKELLLAEINHRVKNNLAMVGSLLNLQQAKASDEYNRELFTESRNRILSIASIHQMLYQNRNFEEVDLKSYIDEIIALLQQAYAHQANNVRINKTIDPVTININKAIPLGLIVNEIVSNSFKHAFKDSNKKTIDIYLRAGKNSYMLEISDNGPGINDMNEALKKNTLGLSLIFDLTEQINARIEYSNKSGSRFMIYFD